MKTADLLKKYMVLGHFASRYETEWLEELRRNPESYYARVREESGIDAAERAICHNEQESHRPIFANAVAAVVEGLIRLSEVDEHLVVHGHRLGDPCLMSEHIASVLFLNRRDPSGRACPKNLDVFGRTGRLGLIGVMFIIGLKKNRLPYAKLRILLRSRPVYTTDGGLFVPRGYNYFGVDLTGYTEWGREDPSMDTAYYLQYACGHTELTETYHANVSAGGHCDDMLGFPGSRAYLATMLPQLGTYLVDLATNIHLAQSTRNT